MTDNKLTLQDCCKYPNAKILDYTGSKDNPNDYKNIYDYVHTLGSFDSRNLEDTTEDIFNDYYVCNCKLILRELGELTDEERKHILNNFIFELYIGTVGISEIVWNNFDDILACCENRKESIDYLRSINIDIDGFLQSGKAVKK